MLDDDGKMLNSSNRKLAISSIYMPGISARRSQRVSSITGVTLGGGPGGIFGGLRLAERPHFLAYVSDRTLTTLCKLGHLGRRKSVLAGYHMYNHLTLPGIQVSRHFATIKEGLVVA